MECSTIPYSTLQYHAILYNLCHTLQYPTIPYSILRHLTIHYNTIPYSSFQYLTLYATLPHSTVPHLAFHFLNPNHKVSPFTVFALLRASIRSHTRSGGRESGHNCLCTNANANTTSLTKIVLCINMAP